MKSSYSAIEKKINSWMTDYLSFFASKQLTERFIKSKTELLFYIIFTDNRDDRLLKLAKLFIQQIENDKGNLVLATQPITLLSTIVSKQYLDVDNELESTDSSICFNHLTDFEKMEFLAYYNVLIGDKSQRLFDFYLKTTMYKKLFFVFPTIEQMYCFTHNIFYLSCLNKVSLNQSLSEDVSMELLVYAKSIFNYTLMLNNLDLLGEIALSIQLLSPKDFDEISKKRLLILASQFLDYVSSLPVSEENFLNSYHTVLVLGMLMEKLEEKVTLDVESR